MMQTSPQSSQNKTAEGPLPLSLLTGFLGAGKTTLLNALLRSPDLANTLVIINEFGEIGLDHLFVETLPGDMMMLSSGCLCCTIRGDLAATLEDIIERRQSGLLPRIDRIILETTGLADPAPILHTLMSHPRLLLAFRLESLITLIDSTNGLATLASQPEALKQAAVADRLVLTKTDLAPLSPDLEHRLRSLNPSAIMLDVAKGQATPAALLNAGLYDSNTKIPDVKRWLNAEALRHDHHHHHDVNRHNGEIRAFCLRSPTPITPSAYDMFVELLRALHGPNLLRVKGIVKLADDPGRPLVIHGVQHVFHPPVRLAAWPDEDTDTRLVFIVKSIPASTITQIWAAFTGQPMTDTPDAASLQHNPLALNRAGLLS